MQNLDNERREMRDVSVDTVDAIVNGSIEVDTFFPQFKHITRGGELKFQLYQGCACSFSLRFEFHKKGVGLEQNRTKCDLCTKNNEDNSERIGGLMDGFDGLMQKTMQTNRGQEVFMSGVESVTGRKLRDEDIGVSHHSEVKSRRGGSDVADVEELHTDAQMLLATLIGLMEWIDINELSPSRREVYVSIIKTVEMIKNKPAFREPTERVANYMAQATQAVEKAEKADKAETQDDEFERLTKMHGLAEDEKTALLKASKEDIAESVSDLIRKLKAKNNDNESEKQA